MARSFDDSIPGNEGMDSAEIRQQNDARALYLEILRNQ